MPLQQVIISKHSSLHSSWWINLHRSVHSFFFAALLKSGPEDEPLQEGVSHWKRGSERCFQSLGQIVEIETEAGPILSLFSLGRKQTYESIPAPLHPLL